MRLRQAAILWIAALGAATGALAADLQGVRVPPSFTVEEMELIGRDARVAGAAQRCAWHIRRALDALAMDGDTSSRVGVVGPEPCPPGSGRASDEGALDIMKILKDVSEQGTSRAGQGGGDGAGMLPRFTADELALIHKDKAGKLRHAARHCAWQLRQAFDTLQHGGSGDWPPQRLCRMSSGDSMSRSAEGALDILKILRDASGDGNQR